MCLHGKCVSHSSAPKVTESCFFGDDPSFKFNNKKCKDLNTKSQHYCYKTTIKRSCCQTCQRFYLPLIDDARLSYDNLPLDEQCKMMNKQPQSSSCVSSLNYNETSVCTSLLCTVSGNETCELFLVASGTKCGEGKICLRGECVEISATIKDKNYWVYLIGSVLCGVITMTASLGIYLIKHSEISLLLEQDNIYEDVRLRLKQRHKTTSNTNMLTEEFEDNNAEDHYVYPEGNEEIYTYNDNKTASLIIQRHSDIQRGEGTSSQVNDAIVTTSSTPGLYSNTYNCLNICENEVTNYGYTLPIQRSNSEYICPVDYDLTEYISPVDYDLTEYICPIDYELSQEMKLQTQTTFKHITTDAKSNSWPKLTDHSNILISKQTGNAMVIWSDGDGRMKQDQEMVSDTGRTSGNIALGDGVYTDTEVQLAEGRSGHDDEYITPVDSVYVDCQEHVVKFPTSTGILYVENDVINM